MKIVNKLLFVKLRIPIKVGSITAEALCQVVIPYYAKTQSDIDVEVLDFDNIGYDGIKIEDWRKLVDFNTSLGIDLNALADDECNKTMTDEFLQNLIDNAWNKNID